MTRWRPTPASGSRPTSATSASARRSCAISASPRLRVMTNNPRKLVGLEGYGLEIVERIPLLTDTTPDNQAYLAAKRDKLGHLLAH